MDYSDVVKIFCDKFGMDEEHVEKVLQKTLNDQGIDCTPEEYLELCKEVGKQKTVNLPN